MSGATAQCPACRRLLELDEHGHMRPHYDWNSYSTEECPGAAEYNATEAFYDESGAGHAHEMPHWAVHMERRILRAIENDRAQDATARLEAATRRAMAALRTLAR